MNWMKRRLQAQAAKSSTLTIVRNEQGTFDVVGADGIAVKSGFADQASAWKWFDDHADADLAMTDRDRRIRDAFSKL